MPTNIHTNVMRRVRTIHTLRSASTGAGASILLLVLSLYLIGREVWVARVWHNMPSIADVGSFATFFTYAFTHTRFSVQVLTLLVIFAVLWFIREFVRALNIHTPKLA